MKKIGKNDPCPCGSGKKYKNCCLRKQDQKTEKNRTRQVMEEIEELLNNREFESIKDMNSFVSGFMEKRNTVPQMDFMGFSSEQVHRMLHAPIETLEDIVQFNYALEPEAFQEIPVVKNTLVFLSRLKDLGPIKATAKGNVSLAFARELYDAFIYPSDRFHLRIRSEEEAVSVNSLRHVLKMCGWLKKAKNHYSLTLKGTKLIEKGFSASHFFTLMNVFVRRFNWGFQDGYAEFWIIQKSVVFSLYLLHRKAQHSVSADELGDGFIRAFPAVLEEVEGTPYKTPLEEIKRCFSLRFLERFCEYFGLADIHREKKGHSQFDLSVKKSSFYDRYINWSHIS